MPEINEVHLYSTYLDQVWTGSQWLVVHRGDECKGRNCAVHNPSNHPLKDAPLNYRADRGIMERICEHGIGHDDPDDLNYRELVGDPDASGVHGCDGCCGGGQTRLEAEPLPEYLISHPPIIPPALTSPKKPSQDWEDILHKLQRIKEIARETGEAIRINLAELDEALEDLERNMKEEN